MNSLIYKSYLGVSPLPTYASIIIEAMIPPVVPDNVNTSPIIPI